MKKIWMILQDINRDESGEIPVCGLLIFALVSVPIILSLGDFSTAFLEWLSQTMRTI